MHTEQFKRGQADRRAGRPRLYGCHLGMRSTLEHDRAQYYAGWDTPPMPLDKIPAHILADLREAAYSDNWLALQTPQEIFHLWLEWNGIIGWSSTIWSAVEELRNAQ